MRKELCLPLVAITLCFVAACSKQGEEYFSAPAEGHPLQYVIQFGTLLGTQKAQMITRREGDETIDGKKYYKVVSVVSGFPGAEPEVSYCRRASTGMYCISGKHKDKPEYLGVPFPVTVGTTWTTSSPDGKVEARAESIETVDLFDRKYDKCLKVTESGTSNGKAFTATAYYAPGIGLVKSIAKVGDVTLDYELEKSN